jgi:hypothetical protein
MVKTTHYHEAQDVREMLLTVSHSVFISNCSISVKTPSISGIIYSRHEMQIKQQAVSDSIALI